MQVTTEQLSITLKNGINKLGLKLSEQTQVCLLKYLQQLIKWNKAYNLSGIKDPQKMVSIHLLDSLSILPYIEGKNILDVGTGAGLPGLVLAICCPEKKIILLDSNGKKTRFMFQTATILGLDNIEVVHGRAEEFKTTQQIDMVVSRAFSSLSQYISWVEHLLNKETRLLAMKGIFPEKEIADLPVGYSLKASYPLEVPGEEGKRHLLEIEH